VYLTDRQLYTCHPVQRLQEVVHLWCHAAHNRPTIFEVEASQLLESAANKQKRKQHPAHESDSWTANSHVTRLGVEFLDLRAVLSAEKER